ncbi:MAG: carbohydrate kinase family protein [Chloroflexota bacterium]
MFRAVTLGDVNMDLVVEAMDVPFGESSKLSGCYFKEIRSLVGGNGVFFAEAARQAGFSESYLLATVGYDETRQLPDVAAQTVINRLEKGGITPLFSWDKHGTGKVIILYQPDDNRIMFADRGANAGFTLDNLPNGAQDIVQKASVFHVSGYTLLREEQRQAAKHLMRLAKEAGVLTSVDIVPHDLFHTHDFDIVAKNTEFARAICVEASTIMGLLRLEQVWEKSREAVLDRLMRVYEYCLIRVNSRSDFVIATRKKTLEFTIPYRQSMTSLRFTDTVYSNAILDFLRNGNKVYGLQKMIESIRALL